MKKYFNYSWWILLFSHGCHYESSKSRTTDGNSGGEGTFFLKINGDTDDGGEVDEAEPEPGEDAHGEIEDGDGGGGRGERHARRRQDRAPYRDQPAAVLVGEVAGDRSWNGDDGYQFLWLSIVFYINAIYSRHKKCKLIKKFPQ